jgi:hypothetical protein
VAAHSSLTAERTRRTLLMKAEARPVGVVQVAGVAWRILGSSGSLQAEAGAAAVANFQADRTQETPEVGPNARGQARPSAHDAAYTIVGVQTRAVPEEDTASIGRKTGVDAPSAFVSQEERADMDSPHDSLQRSPRQVVPSACHIRVRIRDRERRPALLACTVGLA